MVRFISLFSYTKALSEYIPTIHNINFEITSTLNQYNNRIISINGNNNTYGPLIRVHSGDTIHLAVKNNICSSSDLRDAENDSVLKDYCTTTIHFHGLTGIGNENDGVPYLTQKPIEPHEIYTYNITIPKDVCGTFWYHSHTSVQYGDGLRGVLVVDCDSHQMLAHSVINKLSIMSSNDIQSNSLFEIPDYFIKEKPIKDNELQEQIITLSDKYDDWGLNILKNNVISVNGGPDPSLTGSMINGDDSNDKFGTMEPSTKYVKLRILNTGMSGTQVINVENQKMIIIETDGVLVKPFSLNTLSLAVGQRYTAIVKLENNQKYLKIINGCNKMMGYFTKSLWLIREKEMLNALKTNHVDSSTISINSLPGLDKNELFRDLVPIESIGEENDIRSQFLQQGLQSLTYNYMYYSDDFTKQKYGTGIYKMNEKTFNEYMNEPVELEPQGQTVEIIINSVDHMRHPWHLHGHHFQLVSIGNGREGSLNKDVKKGSAWEKYEQDIEYWEKTGKVPTVRDSINIPGSSFAVIRFKLDNPGIWLLHCHVEWHMAKGLGVVFHENKVRNTLPTDNGSGNDNADNFNTASDEISTNDNKSHDKRKVLLVYFSIMLLLNGIFYICIM